jgi:hypothetical protein
MKLDNTTPTDLKLTSICIDRPNAYHIAGQIAAVHLGNKQKDLPAVHFQAVVKTIAHSSEINGRFARIPYPYKVTLEGGRLIPYLPFCYQSATQSLSDENKQYCRCAFEADIINLLAGPLAEAKYVAVRDDEVFNVNLVYLGALKFYGGVPDLLIVNDYLDCLYPDNDNERNQKLAELFLTAYSFVNNPDNWKAINNAGIGIYQNQQDVFSYDELIAMLGSTETAATRGQDKAHTENALVQPRH